MRGDGDDKVSCTTLELNSVYHYPQTALRYGSGNMSDMVLSTIKACRDYTAATYTNQIHMFLCFNPPAIKISNLITSKHIQRLYQTPLQKVFLFLSLAPHLKQRFTSSTGSVAPHWHSQVGIVLLYDYCHQNVFKHMTFIQHMLQPGPMSYTLLEKSKA